MTYVAGDATADVTGNDLQGVSVRTLTSTLAGSSTLLAFNKTEAAFQEYAGTYFPANKAYLLVSAGARSLGIVFADDETTGIKVVDGINRKVCKVIKDGKLIIETSKGKFNITGTRIQ